MIKHLQSLKRLLARVEAHRRVCLATGNLPSPMTEGDIALMGRCTYALSDALNDVEASAQNFMQDYGDILGMIATERQRQDEQWGGSSHDDEHTPTDWISFIHHQVSKFGTEKDGDDPDRFVKIAALAFAALEARQRRY